MAQAGHGSNVRLDGPVNVWFDQKQPTEIHLTLNDGDLVHPESGKDGVHLAVSSRPTSANFDPKTFNTLRALLTRFAKPHPPDSADESIPRRLDSRRRHLAENERTTPSDPAHDRIDELGVAGWISPEQRSQLRGLDVDAMHSIGLAGPWTPELVMRVREEGEVRVAEFVHELGAAGPLGPDDLALILDVGLQDARRKLQDAGVGGGADPAQVIAALRRRDR